MVKVGIVGSTGYTGIELLKILTRHRNVKVVFVTSREEKGKKVKLLFPFLDSERIPEVFIEPVEEEFSKYEVDWVFLALPIEASMDLVKYFVDRGVKVVDLSPAYRLKPVELYAEWYDIHHKYPDLLERAVWALPEYNFESIRNASLIANPGCYPTSVSIPLMPILKHLKEKIDLHSIVIDAKSGVSGAGKKLKTEYLFSELYSNFYAYGIPKHRHTPEIEMFIRDITGESVNITFIPHLLPIERGMFSTIYINVKGDIREEEIGEVMEKELGGKPFVKLLPAGVVPQLKWAVNTNYIFVGYKYLERVKKIVLFGVIDNLVKGASGQAVQNFNIANNFPETEGLIP